MDSLEEPQFYWETGEMLTTGVTIRRIPYNTGSLEIANEVALTATSALNEETTGTAKGIQQGTRLWWISRKKNTCYIYLKLVL